MAMQQIEEFVEAPGRAEAVREIRKKIDSLGVEYLYLQFVSVTGRICGKGIPARHWESIAEKGFQLVYGATVNLFTDRSGDYLGYGPEAPNSWAFPSPKPSASCLGTSVSPAYSARCSATARKGRTPERS